MATASPSRSAWPNGEPSRWFPASKPATIAALELPRPRARGIVLAQRRRTGGGATADAVGAAGKGPVD